jgi:hypothetical protein
MKYIVVYLVEGGIRAVLQPKQITIFFINAENKNFLTQ